MAVYKVPQDVEADDKLIGPFSFRQFIYLIVVAIAIALAWFLGQLFVGLAVLPLPFVIFFGALALPLRKDQPMETYLLAMVHFYLKPKIRLWEPDGNLNNITITAKQTEDIRLTKDFGSEEADRRLSYLAQVIDTGGWASRGVAPSSNMSDTYFNEAMRTEDVMDSTASVVQSFDALIDREDNKRKQMVASQFQQAMSQPPSDTSAQAFSSSLNEDVAEQILESAGNITLQSNPYPAAMNQTVIQPLNQRHQVSAPQRDTTQEPQNQITTPQISGTPTPRPDDQHHPAITPPTWPQTTTQQNVPANNTPPAVSSDIMNLVNNSSHLTVSALAREAHRLESKDSEEVVIDLR